MNPSFNHFSKMLSQMSGRPEISNDKSETYYLLFMFNPRMKKTVTVIKITQLLV